MCPSQTRIVAIPHTGLGDYYLRNRFYDSDTGRFTRRDVYEGRINSPLTLHKYLYAHANPITNTDPTGLSTLTELLNGIKLAAVLASIGAGALIIFTEKGRSAAGLRGRSIDYDTMDEAGKAAIRAINNRSIGENKEYGGVIAQNFFTKKYFYTAPKPGTDHEVTPDDVGLAPLYYSWVVADYHTHGDYYPDPQKEWEYDSDNFSDGDRIGNRNWGIYGYLGNPAGEIKKYVPWSDKSIRLESWPD